MHFPKNYGASSESLPRVVPYFDVLVSAASIKQRFKCLRVILTRFQETRLRVKQEKCQIVVTQVGLLGRCLRFTPYGLIHAIQEAPLPENRMELQAFLGILNFYNMFLPRSISKPPHHLLDKKA